MLSVIYTSAAFALFFTVPDRSVYSRGRFLMKLHVTKKGGFKSPFNKNVCRNKRGEHPDTSRFRVKCKSGFGMERERHTRSMTGSDS